MVQKKPAVAKCENCDNYYFGYCVGLLHWRQAVSPSSPACPDYWGDGAIPRSTHKAQLRKPHRVELTDISAWQSDPNNPDEVYKLETWEVEGDSGHIYTLTRDDRQEYPQCHCQGFQKHGHCYHADAVKRESTAWKIWSVEKNTYDLGRESEVPF